MAVGYLGLAYFSLIMIRKLIRRVFVSNISYQYIFMVTLIYASLLDEFSESLLFVCLATAILTLVALAIKYIYSNRYIIVNSSFNEIQKLLAKMNIANEGNLFRFSSGHEFRIRKNFEGVLIDFFNYSESGKADKERLLQEIRNSSIVRAESWFVEVALSITMCVFIFAFIIKR